MNHATIQAFYNGDELTMMEMKVLYAELKDLFDMLEGYPSQWEIFVERVARDLNSLEKRMNK